MYLACRACAGLHPVHPIFRVLPVRAAGVSVSEGVEVAGTARLALLCVAPYRVRCQRGSGSGGHSPTDTAHKAGALRERRKRRRVDLPSNHLLLAAKYGCQ